MSGPEKLIDQLVRADEFIASGLAKFDAVTERLNEAELAGAEARMIADGVGDCFADFKAQRHAATADARKQCYRELFDWAWSNLISQAALKRQFGDNAGHPQLRGDILTAGAVVRAGLEVADRLANEAPQARSELHRNLWAKALDYITFEAAATAEG